MVNQSAPNRSRYWFKTLVLHFRPRQVSVQQLKFSFTWGLGGMAFVCIFLLFATGLLLQFMYQPFPARAYESVLMIQNEVPFGRLIRNIHYWSANFLILVAFLHFLRIFFTGAFFRKRRSNWVVGLGLLTFVLISNFTGYLLPWDQLSFWAVTICIGMLEYIPAAGAWLQSLVRGGAEVDANTLSLFFSIHTSVMPAMLVIILPYHFWNIRKAGGLVEPRKPGQHAGMKSDRVPLIPNLIIREMVVSLVLIALITWLSIFLDAPMQAKANPGFSPNPTKAPWYFAGLQELLQYFHPFVSIFIIPAGTALALLIIPFIGYSKEPSGIWFISDQGRAAAWFSVLMAVVITPLFIIIREYLDIDSWLPGVPSWILIGLVPVPCILMLLVILYVWNLKHYNTDRNEAVQSIFVFCLTVFIILTLTGTWFRGIGMALTWPWNL